MVITTIQYEGDLHCKATHGVSGATLITDAPKDNQGKGESFSPTDLIAAALGSCILTVMGIVARNQNIDISSSSAQVWKEMASAPVRRVSSLRVDLRVPHALTDAQKQVLQNAAETCPVKQSLNPSIEIVISYIWG